MSQQDRFIDYYGLLCISCSSSRDEIKKAYKKLALKKHPDRNPNNPKAGEEFAILVEAKEILTNKECKNKYDIEYKIYKKELKQREEDKIKRDKMSKIRKEQIEELIEREERMKNEKDRDFYKNYIYKTKQNSIKEELERFRNLIKKQQEKELNERLNKIKEIKKNEKLTKKSLFIKLDKKQCNKGYRKNELESIFKIYGKIIEINMINNNKYIGAQIIFNKNKYVLKALNDKNKLKKQFDLIIINKMDKNENKNDDEKWKEFMNERKHLNHKQYQNFVWNKVEQFINNNKLKKNNNLNLNQIDSDNDIQIIDID